MSDNARNCLKDTTPDNWVFVFALFFFWSYYNKYFINYLQIKSSLVLIINYSIIKYLKKSHRQRIRWSVFIEMS